MNFYFGKKHKVNSLGIALQDVLKDDAVFEIVQAASINCVKNLINLREWLPILAGLYPIAWMRYS